MGMDQAEPMTPPYLGTQDSGIHCQFDPQVCLQGFCRKKGAPALLGLFPEMCPAAVSVRTS